ncbi:MAG: SMP-30/gluconolactonase/LRE family protein [Actinomycetota bacterium]|nr:SMP-30/gluconolactonase/LRE family protein [Actinomycetota bacterium]MDA3026098.1 SMP-30/gluconolactonase/LRE family protein [Actinomycetota bacterium]
MISVEVFDDRRCWLGEGPTATGENNNHVQWVDILNGKVLNKNIETSKTSEYKLDDHVGFAIPRTNGGDVLGTANGPVLRNTDGEITKLPGRETDKFKSRWNDAKVSHTGDLFLGTLSYDLVPKASGLYRISQVGSEIKKLLSELTLANGLDWSVDTQTFYFIDSLEHCVDAFSYDGQEITDRRTIIKFGENEIPDGMCVDGEDGLWIAFWDGSQVRRYDEKYKLSEKINLPVSYTTSCTFAGKDLDQLVITTAHNNEMGKHPQAGMTFICKPGIKGKKTTLFGI